MITNYATAYKKVSRIADRTAWQHNC